MSSRAPDRLEGLLIITHPSELTRAKARVLGLAAHASFEVAPPSGGSARAGLGPASEPSRCTGCGLASAWRGVDSGDYCGAGSPDASAPVPPAAHWSSSGQIAPPLGS